MSILESDMNYSTLKEAYSIDSFEKKIKKKKRLEDEEENDYPRTEKIIKDLPHNDKVNSSQDTVQPVLKQDIEPYYDEEIEKYLNVNDFTNNISFEKQIPKEDIINTPNEEKEENQPILEKHNENHSYKNYINIGLFVLVGLLIIFICDQITEIAISIGMKKTVYILEPYLRDIK